MHRPHDWLFPRLDAVCHHGGSGTTGASLRGALPCLNPPSYKTHLMLCQLSWEADYYPAFLRVGVRVRFIAQTLLFSIAVCLSATNSFKRIA